jgi:hypothetical protein
MLAVEKTSTRPRHPGTRRASADANHCVKRRWVARVAPLAAHGSDHNAKATLRQIGIDRQKLMGRERQSVRLGDDPIIRFGRAGRPAAGPDGFLMREAICQRRCGSCETATRT